MLNQDTICAISTPAGVGGIAVIRVSGNEAFEVCQKCFQSRKADFAISQQKPYTLHFGNIVDKNGEEIDEVLLSIFRSPHSFTGEDTVEISCHGSAFVQSKILQILLSLGCRMASAGEFSMRSFYNGKMDLSQAEAVADLIASKSEAMHRIAISQMRGGFSKELSLLRGKLLDFISLIELELDFSEEDVEFADRSNLQILAQEIREKIVRLRDSFSTGNAIKNGVPVALVGKTNVGKSTLLNSLLQEERAIVSDIAGTTRDTIEDTIVISGISFRFVDTAGIRRTSDPIENIGIERTYEKIQNSQIVIWLVDGTETTEEREFIKDKIANIFSDQKLMLVINKIDTLSSEQKTEIIQEYESQNIETICISAKNDFAIEDIKERLVRIVGLGQIDSGDVIISNARHYEALCGAASAIERVIDGIEQHISGDFLSQDIREASYYLGEITGEISADHILGNIFSKFCIGK